MSEPRFQPRRMTFDEYLAFEESVEARHEFIDGVVYAMTGASLPHNRIGGNIYAFSWNTAGDGPCHLYMEGAKLRVGDDVFYPDVMIVCEPGGEDDRMAYAPCLLVEVQSPSTERLDTTRKLERYRSIPSLRAYLLVRQDYQHVVRYWRDAADAPWQYEEIAAADGRVPVPCPVRGVLTFGQIYRGLAVPERPPLRRVREEAGAEYEAEYPAAGDPAADAPHDPVVPAER